MRKLIVFIVGIILFTGCSETEKNSLDRQKASELYSKLYSLASSYIDSMNHISDSLSLVRITNGYETKLTEIIFSYPPNTDHNMTNGEQDTLSQLTQEFVKIKNIKRKEINNINMDSVKNQ